MHASAPARPHARTHARTRARMVTRTHTHAHARTHARSHARARARTLEHAWAHAPDADIEVHLPGDSARIRRAPAARTSVQRTYSARVRSKLDYSHAVKKHWIGGERTQSVWDAMGRDAQEAELRAISACRRVGVKFKHRPDWWLEHAGNISTPHATCCTPTLTRRPLGRCLAGRRCLRPSLAARPQLWLAIGAQWGQEAGQLGLERADVSGELHEQRAA